MFAWFNFHFDKGMLITLILSFLYFQLFLYALAILVFFLIILFFLKLLYLERYTHVPESKMVIFEQSFFFADFNFGFFILARRN